MVNRKTLQPDFDDAANLWVLLGPVAHSRRNVFAQPPATTLADHLRRTERTEPESSLQDRDLP